MTWKQVNQLGSYWNNPNNECNNISCSHGSGNWNVGISEHILIIKTITFKNELGNKEKK